MCDTRNLGDGTILPRDVLCDPPLNSLGIHDGIVCYNGAQVGSIAFHYCFNCGFSTIRGSIVRQCRDNGSWNGSLPQCSCTSISLKISNSIINNIYNNSIVNFTVSVITYFSDTNSNSISKVSFISSITALLLIIIAAVLIFIVIVIALLKERIKLRSKLQAGEKVIYEEINTGEAVMASHSPITLQMNTDDNVAYEKRIQTFDNN